LKEIILLKNGEITLKGLNKGRFEDTLIRNIKYRLSSIGKFKISKAQSTIYVEPASDEADLNKALERLKKVFGVIALSKACVCEKDFEDIKLKAQDYLEELVYAKTFKVEAKRADKRFPMTSPEICSELGGFLLEKFPHLTVDVHNPEVTVTVEIRDFAAYVRGKSLEGAGGLPVGTASKAAILISGGIDSPVAAWMMAKRGMTLLAIHFASPPYTSVWAEQKVIDLLTKVSEYSGKITLMTVPFTKIQETISKECTEELFTVLMRRFMMKISDRIAKDNECLALITGESVAQVASQTVEALYCTDNASTLPVFRPVIGMDKEEIVKISRKIDTFDISIRPYEDCCTVFTPKHPKTKPILEYVVREEEKLDCEALIEEAISNVDVKKITYK